MVKNTTHIRLVPFTRHQDQTWYTWVGYNPCYTKWHKLATDTYFWSLSRTGGRKCHRPLKHSPSTIHGTWTTPGTRGLDTTHFTPRRYSNTSRLAFYSQWHKTATRTNYYHTINQGGTTLPPGHNFRTSGTKHHSQVHTPPGGTRWHNTATSGGSP